MPIATIRSKGDDHIGAEGTDDFSHLSGQYFLINVLQCPVHKVYTSSMLDTEPLASEMEFLFTHGAQGRPCSDAWHTDLACLTSCCRDDHHLRTSGNVLSKSASRAEAFIIRMGEDSKNAF